MRTSVARTSEAKEIHFMMPPIYMLTALAVRSFMRMTGPKGKHMVFAVFDVPQLTLLPDCRSHSHGILPRRMWRANPPVESNLRGEFPDTESRQWSV